MTDLELAFWNRAHDRIARLQPDVAAALLRAFAIVASSVDEAELAHLIRTGAFDQIVRIIFAEAMLDRAMLPLRSALRATVERSFTLNTPYLPRAGKINGTVAVFFDRLNPRVIEALRTLETRVVTATKDSIRETALQTIRRGIEASRAPAAIARDVRAVIALNARQEAAVANFRRMLETGDADALTRKFRDRRFDATITRAFADGGKGLTPDAIDRMVAANRRKALAMNAETVSRTATTQAYKMAQKESWASAIDRGIVDGGSLRRQWIGIGDDRERPGHLIMNDQVAAFDEPYSNGDTFAGEGDPWNCRCIDRVFVGRS